MLSNFVTFGPSNRSLEDSTLRLLALGLLQLSDIDVAPQEQASQAERDECYSGDNHLPLHILVGVDDRGPDWAAHGVGQLDRDISVDRSREILAVLGEPIVKLFWEYVGPERTRDCETDRSADGAKQTPHRKGDGNLLMADTSHDRKLCGKSPDSTVDTIEKLAHDQISSF